MHFTTIFRKRPQAMAEIKGSADYPDIRGNLYLYETGTGVLAVTEVFGLPKGNPPCDHPVFGFHIHEGESCTGTQDDPFADAQMHLNPNECPHPYHAGDLPPLFGNQGYAFSAVFTNRFTADAVIGKTVIIHAQPDDFSTQPAGNSGMRIACGEIRSGR